MRAATAFWPVLVIAVFAAAGAHAQGQPSPDWTACTDANAPWDTRIDGCSKVIQSGNQTPKKLAIAYSNRGYAHGHKGDYDDAIADFTKAIELDRNDANT